MRKKYLIVLSLIFLVYSFFSQDKADSLYALLKTQQSDTNRIRTLNDFAWTLIQATEYDSANAYLITAKEKAEKTDYKFGIATSYNYFGQIGWRKGNFPEALKNFLSALKIWEEIKNDKGMAIVHNNIGIINSEKGNYPEALPHFLMAQKIFERIGHKLGLANCYNNIGNVYTDLEDYDMALKNFRQALAIFEKAKEERMTGNAYNNLGRVFLEKHEYPEAIKNFSIALKIREKIGDRQGVSNSLMSLGSVYLGQGDRKKALEYHLEALKICEESNNEEGKVIATNNIGMSYFELKEYKKAREFLLKGLELAKKLDSKDDIKESYEGLDAVDEATGNFKGAYYNYKMLISYRDSMISEENTKKTVQQQMQFDFEKEQAKDSLQNVLVLQQNEMKHAEEINRQRIYTFGGLIGLILMALVAVISFNAYRQKQKANKEISEQKNIVEEKQKEILDSIHYAKRIQRSLLPTNKYFEKSLKRLKDKGE